MASNKNFKATKQRSHSSPELQITSTSAESSSDENVQKILSELVEYKDKVENSAQSLGLPERSQTILRPRVKHGNERQNFANDGAGETVLDSTVSGTGTASEIRNRVFFKGFKFLSHLRGRNCMKDSGKKGSVSEDLDGDMQASFGPRQQRSKSVCGTLLNKLKCKGQKQSNHLSSSDDSDHDVLKSHAHCLDKVSKRKHKRHKVKSTSSLSSDVSKAKSLKHADLENDYCDNVQHAEDNKRTVEDGSSCRTASSAVENDSEIVSIPSFYRVPAALANDQAQLAPQHQASSIPASQPFPHVVTTTQNIYAHYDALSENGTTSHRTVHTQIDYMHCLIPDQWSIINSPYYWGQINRFEADNLLINKEEGTFILRDSTQEEFVFSVSFRRYGRTLHARIEQWNHKFTFDAHDPGVHSSQTICGLLEHYKNPNFCMFFEPMLTAPLLKKNPQSLQELCRARICTHISYNGISSLNLPIVLREYLRVYHYKQRLRVRKMEVDRRSVEDNQPGVITNTCLSSVHSNIL